MVQSLLRQSIHLTKELGNIVMMTAENRLSEVIFTPQQIEMLNTKCVEGYDIYDDQQYFT